MSCILLNHEHHEALAGAFKHHGKDFLPLRMPDGNVLNTHDIGKALALENAKAYTDRYETPAGLTQASEIINDAVSLVSNARIERWRFEIGSNRVSVVQLFKWIHSYQYQASDSKTFEGSYAEKICKTLEYILATKLDGYDDAEWTCDELPRA
jgi:hypothetical protein